MTRAIGFMHNPEPDDEPGERWRERRREHLADDLSFIATVIAESPLMAYSEAWKHSREDGTTKVYPAVTTGAKTLRALMDGTDAEAIAAVHELRAYVDDKIEEQVREDWQDFCDGLGEP